MSLDPKSLLDTIKRNGSVRIAIFPNVNWRTFERMKDELVSKPLEINYIEITEAHVDQMREDRKWGKSPAEELISFQRNFNDLYGGRL